MDTEYQCPKCRVTYQIELPKPTGVTLKRCEVAGCKIKYRDGKSEPSNRIHMTIDPSDPHGDTGENTMADTPALIKRLRAEHFPHGPTMQEAADALEIYQDLTNEHNFVVKMQAEIERLCDRIKQLGVHIDRSDCADQIHAWEDADDGRV